MTGPRYGGFSEVLSLRSDTIEFRVARDFLLDRQGSSIIDLNRG
jgi:hypothetical protein